MDGEAILTVFSVIPLVATEDKAEGPVWSAFSPGRGEGLADSFRRGIERGKSLRGGRVSGACGVGEVRLRREKLDG